jgi:hypothetical protein
MLYPEQTLPTKTGDGHSAEADHHLYQLGRIPACRDAISRSLAIGWIVRGSNMSVRRREARSSDGAVC